jgi:hypothetical protein
MSCPNIDTIQRTQCIGNSLNIINNNFSNLRESTCDNDSRISLLESQNTDLSTRIDELSSVIIPGAAKAWCKFSGIRDSNNVLSNFLTDRFIFKNFNILSVYKKAAGDYRIIFANTFPDNQYAVIGTSTQKLDSLSKFTWLQPYNITASFTEVKVQSSTGTTIDPDFISVAFY